MFPFVRRPSKDKTLWLSLAHRSTEIAQICRVVQKNEPTAFEGVHHF